MGNGHPQTREMMNRLALSCSALARAGQVLSMVNDPAKVHAALTEASNILETDAKTSRLPQMEAAARECKTALHSAPASEGVAVCRRIATSLARLASSLATEVQEQTRKAGKVPSATPPPAAPVKPAEESVPSASAAAPKSPPAAAPKPAPAAPAAPTPVAKPKPAPEKQAAKPKVDLTRVRVAATAEEKSAVTAALEAGHRMAQLKNGTVIDTRSGLMWSAAVALPMAHDEAVNYAAGCRLGGYSNWRLPTPGELQELLAGSGRDLGATMFKSADGGAVTAIWSSETSRKWLFMRQATVVQVAAGNAQSVAVTRSNVHVLVVRSA